ncbi:MAG: cupin domain-containing protein [Desulfosporosinus sp.]|nr:cupin domain-containing protein [Desulfosporosinus sp.]
MSRPESDIEIVEKHAIQPFIEDNGKVRNFPMFPFDSTRRFEMYTIELDGGGYLEAEAHPQGTQEFVTVFSGEVTINVNGEDFVVTTGNSMRFRAEGPHAYKNSGDTICLLSMVIKYGYLLSPVLKNI